MYRLATCFWVSDCTHSTGFVGCADKTYYILHFKKIYDVMDREHTVFVEGTDAVIKVALDAEKVKDLKIFNSQPSISDVIISEDVRRAIRKNKLDEGLDFLPIYCS